MLRILVLCVALSGPAFAAPEIGKDYGKLGPSGLQQAPVFKLNAEYELDYLKATKCPLKSHDGEVIMIGKKAVYADDPKQGVVVLLDEFARRYALDYCWR
jgi:hypothetical protein